MDNSVRRFGVTFSLFLILMVPLIVVIAGCQSMTQLSPPAEGRLDPSKWVYDYMVFEIARVEGAAPDPVALDRFAELLEFYGICPADRISFGIHDPAGPAFDIWTVNTIKNYEAKHRTIQESSDGRVAAVFVSYLEGPTLMEEGFRNLGGIQYTDSSFAIFKGVAGGKEAAVLLHEFGHMIGVRRTSEGDPYHHCPSENCVMYPSVGSAYAVMCDDCVVDLARAIRVRRGSV